MDEVHYFSEGWEKTTNQISIYRVSTCFNHPFGGAGCCSISFLHRRLPEIGVPSVLKSVLNRLEIWFSTMNQQFSFLGWWFYNILYVSPNHWMFQLDDGLMIHPGLVFPEHEEMSPASWWGFYEIIHDDTMIWTYKWNISSMMINHRKIPLIGSYWCFQW